MDPAQTSMTPFNQKFEYVLQLLHTSQVISGFVRAGRARFAPFQVPEVSSSSSMSMTFTKSTPQIDSHSSLPTSDLTHVGARFHDRVYKCESKASRIGVPSLGHSGLLQRDLGAT